MTYILVALEQFSFYKIAKIYDYQAALLTKNLTRIWEKHKISWLLRSCHLVVEFWIKIWSCSPLGASSSGFFLDVGESKLGLNFCFLPLPLKPPRCGTGDNFRVELVFVSHKNILPCSELPTIRNVPRVSNSAKFKSCGCTRISRQTCPKTSVGRRNQSLI